MPETETPFKLEEINKASKVLKKRKVGRPPKARPITPPQKLETIPVYAKEAVKLSSTVIEVKGFSAVPAGAICFIQDNPDCLKIQKFRINPGKIQVKNPLEITVLIENLWEHDIYEIKAHDRIADIIF